MQSHDMVVKHPKPEDTNNLPQNNLKFPKEDSRKSLLKITPVPRSQDKPTSTTTITSPTDGSISTVKTSPTKGKSTQSQVQSVPTKTNVTLTSSSNATESAPGVKCTGFHQPGSYHRCQMFFIIIATGLCRRWQFNIL